MARRAACTGFWTTYNASQTGSKPTPYRFSQNDKVVSYTVPQMGA